MDSYETQETPDAGSKRSSLIFYGLIVILISGILYLLFYAYNTFFSYNKVVHAPLIKAESHVTKKRPESPGGMDIPHVDKEIYDNLDNSSIKPKENILPLPEEPMFNFAQEEYSFNNSKTVKPKELPEKEQPEEILETESNIEGPDPILEEEFVDKSDFKQEPEVIKPKELEVKIPENPEIKAPKVKEKLEVTRITSKNSNLPLTIKNNNAKFYKVQVAAVRSSVVAEIEWKRLKKAHPKILGKYNYSLQKKDFKEKGIYYRIQIGNFKSFKEANNLCRSLSARNQNCMVVVPGEK